MLKGSVSLNYNFDKDEKKFQNFKNLIKKPFSSIIRSKSEKVFSKSTNGIKTKEYTDLIRLAQIKAKYFRDKKMKSDNINLNLLIDEESIKLKKLNENKIQRNSVVIKSIFDLFGIKNMIENNQFKNTLIDDVADNNNSKSCQTKNIYPTNIKNIKQSNKLTPFQMQQVSQNNNKNIIIKKQRVNTGKQTKNIIIDNSKLSYDKNINNIFLKSFKKSFKNSPYKTPIEISNKNLRQPRMNLFDKNIFNLSNSNFYNKKYNNNILNNSNNTSQFQISDKNTFRGSIPKIYILPDLKIENYKSEKNKKEIIPNNKTKRQMSASLTIRKGILNI